MSPYQRGYDFGVGKGEPRVGTYSFRLAIGVRGGSGRVSGFWRLGSRGHLKRAASGYPRKPRDYEKLTFWRYLRVKGFREVRAVGTIES